MVVYSAKGTSSSEIPSETQGTFVHNRPATVNIQKRQGIALQPRSLSNGQNDVLLRKCSHSNKTQSTPQFRRLTRTSSFYASADGAAVGQVFMILRKW